MLFCILEEIDGEIRSQMLSYFVILMQYSIELSQIQEMEKGKLYWEMQIKLRNAKVVILLNYLLNLLILQSTRLVFL